MGLEPVSVYHMEICKIRCEAARAEGDRAGLEESLVRRSASDPSYQDSGRSSADLTTPARPSRLHRVFSTAANLCSNCLRILHSWRQVQILMFGCRHYPPSSRVQFCWIPLKSNLASFCVKLFPVWRPPSASGNRFCFELEVKNGPAPLWKRNKQRAGKSSSVFSKKSPLWDCWSGQRFA